MPLLRLERTLAKPELATKKSPQVSTNAKKKKYGPWPSESRTSDDGVYIYKKKYNPWFFYSEVVPKKYCYFTRAAAETREHPKICIKYMEVLLSHLQLIAGCLAYFKVKIGLFLLL